MDIFNTKKIKTLCAKLIERSEQVIALKEMADGFKGIAHTYQLKYELAEREVARLRAENEALSNKNATPKLDINAYKMVGLIKDHAERKYIKEQLHYLIPASILKGIVNSIVEHE